MVFIYDFYNKKQAPEIGSRKTSCFSKIFDFTNGPDLTSGDRVYAIPINAGTVIHDVGIRLINPTNFDNAALFALRDSDLNSWVPENADLHNDPIGTIHRAAKSDLTDKGKYYELDDALFISSVIGSLYLTGLILEVFVIYSVPSS